MVSAGHFGSRTFWAVLLLCAVFAQSAALELGYERHSSSQHCCLLCHLGPLPFLQETIASAAEPLVAIAWLPDTTQREGKHEVLLSADSSRAPPISPAISL